MAQDSRLWVVLTLREPVAALDPYARLLPGRLRSRYYMQRMNAAAALEAITNPAQKEGRPFGPGAGDDSVNPAPVRKRTSRWTGTRLCRQVWFSGGAG